MKKVFTILLLLSINTIVFGQLTKKLKNYEFQNGTKIEPGFEIELVNGSNPHNNGLFLWVFEGTKQPIPKEYCDASFNRKKFEIVEILSLKGVPNKDESIIGVFYIDKKRFYCFINQALKDGEIIF